MVLIARISPENITAALELQKRRTWKRSGTQSTDQSVRLVIYSPWYCIVSKQSFQWIGYNIKVDWSGGPLSRLHGVIRNRPLALTFAGKIDVRHCGQINPRETSLPFISYRASTGGSCLELCEETSVPQNFVVVAFYCLMLNIEVANV